jgi:hypothetical protein
MLYSPEVKSLVTIFSGRLEKQPVITYEKGEEKV